MFRLLLGNPGWKSDSIELDTADVLPSKWSSGEGVRTRVAQRWDSNIPRRGQTHYSQLAWWRAVTSYKWAVRSKKLFQKFFFPDVFLALNSAKSMFTANWRGLWIPWSPARPISLSKRVAEVSLESNWIDFPPPAVCLFKPWRFLLSSNHPKKNTFLHRDPQKVG